MSTFDVKIWQSVKLTDYCETNHQDKYRAAKRAQSYLESASNRTSHTIDANVVYGEDVPAPVEDYDQEFQAINPCNNYSWTYSSTVAYFRDWVDCRSEYGPAKDSNLLLTSKSNTDGGNGYRGGKYCHAQTGQKISDSSSAYANYDSHGSPRDAIQTAMHEVGHNLMRPPTDSDGDFPDSDDDGAIHHDVGTIYEHGGQKANTAMSSVEQYWNLIDEQNGGNECNKNHDTEGENIPLVELTWSDCCVGKWRVK